MCLPASWAGLTRQTPARSSSRPCGSTSAAGASRSSRRRRVLGESHPRTLDAVVNLVGVLHDMGEIERARAWWNEFGLSKRYP